MSYHPRSRGLSRVDHKGMLIVAALIIAGIAFFAIVARSYRSDSAYVVHDGYERDPIFHEVWIDAFEPVYGYHPVTRRRIVTSRRKIRRKVRRPLVRNGKRSYKYYHVRKDGNGKTMRRTALAVAPVGVAWVAIRGSRRYRSQRHKTRNVSSSRYRSSGASGRYRSGAKGTSGAGRYRSKTFTTKTFGPSRFRSGSRSKH